ncbi:MAG: HlyD family efflux transporter periplasmic adaptor subunit, partial [Algiphilus sp.]
MRRLIIPTAHTVLFFCVGILWWSALHAGGGHAPTSMASTDEVAKGPHGGRWLEKAGLQLELALVEGGLPPEYRAWPSVAGTPIPPEAVELEVRLERLGGTTDVIAFEAAGDFLRGDTIVTEPHSFDVTVKARYQGRDYEWAYESHEGRTQIPAAIAEDAGVTTGRAGPVTLHRTLRLSGRVAPNPARIARVAAPYPGEVTAINVQLFDVVEKGDPLATVIARDSVRPTILRAPLAGTVLQRHAALGQQAGTDAL